MISPKDKLQNIINVMYKKKKIPQDFNAVIFFGEKI